jgi:hypothetical protein
MPISYILIQVLCESIGGSVGNNKLTSRFYESWAATTGCGARSILDDNQ